LQTRLNVIQVSLHITNNDDITLYYKLPCPCAV